MHWTAALDLAQFFATMPHGEILAGLSERIAAQQFLRLMARMRKAGGPTPGEVGYDELGRPQGSMVSPVIAHACLDHVLEQWCMHTVSHQCRGYWALRR